MPKLTDDPRVADAIEKAEARGANNERKRINQILKDAGVDAGELEDKAAKKAAKDVLKGVKDRIRDEA